MEKIHLERPFLRHRINTRMTHHSLAQTASAPADSFCVCYPISDELRLSPNGPAVLDRARRAVNLYLCPLQDVLAKDGYQIFLDRIEHDLGHGWLIHILGDPATITMLRGIASGKQQADGALALMVSA
jgi:hypothetical protein